MKILMLTRYGRQGASSRLRTLQFLPWLADAGWTTVIEPLIPDEMLASKYAHGLYDRRQLLWRYVRRVGALLARRRFDLLWIEKEALPWWPAALELLLLRDVPYVLDFDDAVFHNYDLHPSKIKRRLFAKRIDRLMQHSRLVVAGNRYLADRAASAGAQWVEVVPTGLDTRRYPPTPTGGLEPPRIVWIGSPSTARYLDRMSAPLRDLAGDTRFALRVVGGGEPQIPGVTVEACTWAEGKEAELLSQCMIGIMPLDDTPWEQGKCAYKLLQYMACGLPVVASPVGANVDVVKHGENGFLARDSDEWSLGLRELLSDPTTRHRMGAAGRRMVEASFDVHVIAPVIVSLLRRAATAPGASSHVNVKDGKR